MRIWQIGVAAELILAVLNTNVSGLYQSSHPIRPRHSDSVGHPRSQTIPRLSLLPTTSLSAPCPLTSQVHVYQVSPALTLIEKTVTRRLADLFNLGPSAGGISQPGGSASNASSLVIARNTLYPQTKTSGINGTRYVLFTSEHGHYSLEKAAQMFGFGSDAVIPVPVDSVGRMIPGELDRVVRQAKERGEIPLYVNATAGTTVLGSYDPFDEIADVCDRHGMWMHIDGSWGGCVVFNKELSRDRLKGAGRAHSIAVTPHKMLGVPVTSSFLLVKDLKWAWESMTLPAG